MPLQLIRAGNPGPMTLEGTNSYVLFSRDSRTALLLDPGPALSAHREALLRAVADAGARLEAIVLSHQHADHSELLGSVEEWAPRVPVYAALEEFRRFTDPLYQGEEIVFGSHPDDRVEVQLTPGHTRDSICVLWRDALFSGDTVLGRGTTIITYPEGTLQGYLSSLDHLIALAESGRFTWIAPAHGPRIDDPLGVLRGYRAHRHQRLDQVRRALSGGARSAEDVVERVYRDVDADVRPAAVQSVRAQLDYLKQHP